MKTYMIMIEERIKIVCSKVKLHLDQIISFINAIPNEWNGIMIMSDKRKEYYLKTFLIRLNKLIEKQ